MLVAPSAKRYAPNSSSGWLSDGIANNLWRELAAHSDMLLVQAIGWNESRVRGPVFSLAWWMQYSARAFQHAHHRHG